MAKSKPRLLLLVACLSLFPMSVPALISRALRKHLNSNASSSSKRTQLQQQLQSSRRLDYVHGYHAGNYADVVKHSVLILLLEHMKKKESPFVYVDTHAGAGSYPLDSKESSQLNEFQQGIGRLLFHLDDNDPHPPLDDPLRTLVTMTSNSNINSSVAVYPGSPMIAKTLSRSQDTLLLFEKARDQFDRLRQNMNDDDDNSNDMEIRNDDGYKGLADYAEYTKDLRRALVFVDPPYQFGSDTDQASRLVQHLRWHWKSARVALWYPASDAVTAKSNRLWSLLRDALDDDAEILAFEMYSQDAVGTGMVIVNPPYGIEADLRRVLPQIAKLLREETPTMRMKWL